jgi:hypothetical protein
MLPRFVHSMAGEGTGKPAGHIVIEEDQHGLEVAGLKTMGYEVEHSVNLIAGDKDTAR